MELPGQTMNESFYLRRGTRRGSFLHRFEKEVMQINSFVNDCVSEMRINTSKLLFGSSLKAQCVKAIMDSFRKSPKYFQGVASLPKLLRIEVLKKLSIANKGEKNPIPLLERFKIVTFLMHDIYEFNFKWANPSTNEECEMPMAKFLNLLRPIVDVMFEQLVEKCRNSLQSLVVGEEGHIWYFRHIGASNPVRKDCLLKMVNLRRLELHHHFLQPDEFYSICITLVELEQVHCNLLDTSRKHLFESLNALKKLEIFIFKPWATFHKTYISELPKDDLHQLYLYCMNQFPRIKVVGSVADENVFDENTYLDLDILDEVPLLEISKIGHLRVREPFTEAQAAFYSNITVLGISMDDYSTFEPSDVEILLSFKKIKSLIFYVLPYHTVHFDLIERLLQTYGPNLINLQFHSPMNTCLFIGAILGYCPNLKNLKMYCGPLMDPQLLPNTHLSQQLNSLTELHLVQLWLIKEPACVLINLFTASNLETLVLKQVWLDPLMVHLALCGLNFQKVIAPKLTTLEISVRFPNREGRLYILIGLIKLHIEIHCQKLLHHLIKKSGVQNLFK
ncbi:Hypothetical predicted protein [Cloeon dipterum]|uniref:Uncharacterized protein n=1 Tax=Cloeon dipterum TaxID=197152 RepID=A0A8S1CZ83_9INSE|nr:Hypothetical predicted protein [Cloeon dipterum]